MAQLLKLTIHPIQQLRWNNYCIMAEMAIAIHVLVGGRGPYFMDSRIKPVPCNGAPDGVRNGAAGGAHDSRANPEADGRQHRGRRQGGWHDQRHHCRRVWHWQRRDGFPLPTAGPTGRPTGGPAGAVAADAAPVMVTKEATRGEWMTITKDETTEETTTKGEKGEGTAATSEEEEGMTAMSSSTFSFYGCPATLSPPKGAWWSRSCTTSPYTPPPPHRPRCHCCCQRRAPTSAGRCLRLRMPWREIWWAGLAWTMVGMTVDVFFQLQPVF